ncbi:hypothetical protein GCM10020258_20210 [Sphingomonas yabuuchiae]
MIATRIFSAPGPGVTCLLAQGWTCRWIAEAILASCCAPIFAAGAASDLEGDGSGDRPFRKLSPRRDPRGLAVVAVWLWPLPRAGVEGLAVEGLAAGLGLAGAAGAGLASRTGLAGAGLAGAGFGFGWGLGCGWGFSAGLGWGFGCGLGSGRGWGLAGSGLGWGLGCG